MSFMSSRLWAWHEMLRSLRKDWGLVSLTALLTALALSLPLFVGQLLYDLGSPMRALPTNPEVTVFLEKNAKTKQVAELLEQFPEVNTVTTIARDEALASLNERLGIKDLLKVDNPLPDILVLHLRSDVPPERMEGFLAELNKNKNVDMTAFDNEWLKKFQLMTRLTLTVVGALGAVGALLVVVVLLLVVRMATHAIEPVMTTLFFFGASPWFAIRPWAWRGAFLMGVASLLALVLNAAGISLLRAPLQALAESYQSSLLLHMPDLQWSAAFIFGAATLGAAATSLAAWRIWYRVQRQNSLM